MLTLNADEHPLMNRMHKPDSKLASDKQDKRSVIPIELTDVGQWLEGAIKDVLELELKLTQIRGHIIPCAQGAANVQGQTAVLGAIQARNAPTGACWSCAGRTSSTSSRGPLPAGSAEPQAVKRDADNGRFEERWAFVLDSADYPELEKFAIAN